MHDYAVYDVFTDTAFGVADKDFSPAGVGNGKDTPWPAYRTWYETRGEKGMEPPALIKETIKWREQLATSPDPKARDEAAQKLLSAVYRTGQRFGVSHLIEVLQGRDDPLKAQAAIACTVLPRPMSSASSARSEKARCSMPSR